MGPLFVPLLTAKRLSVRYRWLAVGEQVAEGSARQRGPSKVPELNRIKGTFRVSKPTHCMCRDQATSCCSCVRQGSVNFHGFDAK